MRRARRRGPERGGAESRPTRSFPDPTTPAHATPHDTRRRNRSGPLRVPGQAVLRPVRHPDVGRRRRRHRRRGGRPGRGRRLPGRGQGAGQGGRPGQGGGREVGRQRRRGPPARRQHPRARHQGPRGQATVGRARLGHRQGVLRQLHPGPAQQDAPGHALGRGRRGDRRGGGHQPRRHRHVAHQSHRRARRGRRPRVGGPGQPGSRGPGADGLAAGPALPLLRRGRLRPGRDQPPDPHARGQGARARRQGHPGRERHLPAPRVGGLRRRLGHRPEGEDGQGKGPELHRARAARWASSPTAPGWP